MIRIPVEGLTAAQLLALGVALREASKAEVTKLREAAATELYAVIELVRRALCLALYPLRPNSYLVNLYAVYPDRAIVSDGGRLYALPYTIDANNNVTVGAKTEVVESYTPVAMTEAAPPAPSSRR
jgi:hypothetical protein